MTKHYIATYSQLHHQQTNTSGFGVFIYIKYALVDEDSTGRDSVTRRREDSTSVSRSVNCISFTRETYIPHPVVWTARGGGRFCANIRRVRECKSAVCRVMLQNYKLTRVDLRCSIKVQISILGLRLLHLAIKLWLELFWLRIAFSLCICVIGFCSDTYCCFIYVCFSTL